MQSGTFRLHGVNLFLTYPQCDTSFVDAEASFKRKLKHYEWSVIAREKHADGTPHLHAFVRLKLPCNLTAPTCLDIIGTGGVVSHGNYQVARNPSASLNYVCKDGEVECFGTTLDSARACFTTAGRKRTATELIMDELHTGMDLTLVAKKYPEHSTFIMLHYDRIERFFAQTILAHLCPSLIFVRAQTQFPPKLWNSQICQWLNSNLMAQPRPFSKKQLWIWGPTCSGKTTLKNRLMTCQRIYSVPNEEFYDEYKDTLFDLVIFDEYLGGKTIQWMNQFCDGSEMPLRQKGKQTVKRKNIPVIVLSNLSIRSVYHKVDQAIYDTIARRFIEVELGKPMELELLTRQAGSTAESALEPSNDTAVIE